MSNEPLTDEKLADYGEIAQRRKELFATEAATTPDAMELFTFVEMASLLVVEVRRLRELVEVLEKKHARMVSRLPKHDAALGKARKRSAARRKVKGR